MTPPFRAAILAAALLAVLAVAAPAATGPTPVRYEADTPHSQVGFTARYMGVVDVRGSFPEFRGTLMLVADDLPRSTVSVVMDANSIETGNKQRDKDLRGPDFLDVVRFPKLRFTSTSVAAAGDGLAVTGDLTLRNVTKSVVLDVQPIHPAMTDALGVTRIGYLGRTRINRFDFGVVGNKFWNNEFAPGRFAIGDTIEIALTLEARIEDLDRRKAPAGKRRPVVDSLAAVARAQGAAGVGRALRRVRESSAYDLSAGALTLLGGRLLQRGDEASAIEVLRQAAEIHPNAADVHAELAEAYWVSGQREPAIQAATRAVTLDPYHTSARETLRWARGDGRAW